jgi:hypothetical protein
MSTTVAINTTADDLYGNSNSVFRDTYAYINVGKNASGYTYKSWIPFTVALDQGLQIDSATLKLRAYNGQAGDTCKIKIGCVAADNASKPGSWASLNGLTMTTAYTADASVAHWSAGNEYTYDITTAVQEVLDRGGFSNGNVIAVLIVDNGSSTGAERDIAAYEDTSYAQAILEIVYTEDEPPAGTFVPKIVSF